MDIPFLCFVNETCAKEFEKRIDILVSLCKVDLYKKRALFETFRRFIKHTTDNILLICRVVSVLSLLSVISLGKTCVFEPTSSDGLQFVFRKDGYIGLREETLVAIPVLANI